MRKSKSKANKPDLMMICIYICGILAILAAIAQFGIMLAISGPGIVEDVKHSGDTCLQSHIEKGVEWNSQFNGKTTLIFPEEVDKVVCDVWATPTK